MKKKTIEKVPYLGGKKSKKKVGFVAAVAVMQIKEEPHLFLEVYQNKKENLETPVYRLVYTGNDWGCYEVEKNAWSKRKIKGDSYNGVIWDKGKTDKTEIKTEDILILEKFSGYKNWNQEKWWDCIDRLENHINWMRWKRSQELREQRLQKRNASIEKLPKKFQKWYETELFENENYMFYKRKGRYATFTCSHCGAVYTYPTERTDSYKGQFEHVVQVPKVGQLSRCEICDAKGTYKHEGNKTQVHGMKKYCYTVQKYKETGVIVRYFQIEKLLQVGKKETFVKTEICRNYLEKGEKRIIDYNLYSGWTKEAEWYDHNIGGMGAQIVQEPGALYVESLKSLKGTEAEYSGIEVYLQQYETSKIANYLAKYLEYPCIEMFSKMRLEKLVYDMVENHQMGYIQNKTATTPQEVLGIRKEKLKLLQRHRGDTDILYILQMEYDLEGKWSEEQVEKIATLLPGKNELEGTLEWMSLQQFLNRIERYAKVTFEECIGCGQALGYLKHIAVTYMDYLDMRRALGYDMTNSIYLVPRDLENAHRAMLEERDKEKIDKRILEAEKSFPQVRKRYRSLLEKYKYEDERMCIRPARSAKEIVEEGRILHHCVGGDNYLKKHAKGTSTILFLRHKDTPDIPYVTIEIEDTRIKQWYGAYDKKPNQKENQTWLNAYEVRIKCQENQKMEEKRMHAAG